MVLYIEVQQRTKYLLEKVCIFIAETSFQKGHRLYKGTLGIPGPSHSTPVRAIKQSDVLAADSYISHSHLVYQVKAAGFGG